MAQNSVSISMTKLRNDAFLAKAGYKNMGGNEKDGLLKKRWNYNKQSNRN